MSKEKRLGRGLEALLGKVAAVQQENENEVVVDQGEPVALSIVSDYEADESDEVDKALTEAMRGQKTQGIPIDLIDRNPQQPRFDFDQEELNMLVSSIEQHGIVTPITIRPTGDRYQLIAGERRLRAAKMANLTEIPAYIIEVDDQEMAELALTENMQRKDLNAIEKAVAFHAYIEAYGGSHEELAKRLDLDRSTVTNMMRLLDLPDEIQNSIRKNELTQGHARALLPLEEWEQIEVATKIIQDGWNVRQTEKYVKELLEGESPAQPQKKSRASASAKDDPQIRELEQQFRSVLGMKVKLTSNDKGKGKLVIQFDSSKDFERVYQLICPTR